MTNSRPLREVVVLNVAGYLTLVCVGLLGTLALDLARDRWISVALLAVLGLLIAPHWEEHLAPRHWHLVMAIGAGCVTALLLLPSNDNTSFAILFFLFSSQAMLVFPQRGGLLWLVAFMLLTALAFSVKFGFAEGVLITLPHAGGYYFFGVFGSLLKREEAAKHESQRLLRELQEAHRELQAAAARAEELAVTQERNRLSREMHDTLGHRLTVAAVQLEGAQRLIATSPERATLMVGTVREEVREALTDLRRTVATLRAPIEEDLSLPLAFTRLGSSFEAATGLVVHLLLPPQVPQLAAAQRHALYRAAQEALTNVQRHAQARNVWLQIQLRADTLSLLVSDDGVGTTRAGEAGFGLRGLQERAAQLGGCLSLAGRRGGGTQLAFQIPVATGESQ